MHIPHATEEDLILHYYAELSTSEETAMSTHLGECHECHGAYRRLQQVLMTVDEPALATPDLPEGFEKSVWARLQPALDRDQRGWVPGGLRAWLAANPREWLAGLFAAPARLAWAAGVMALVVGAFYAGRLSPRATDPSPAPTTSAPGQVRERILLIDLGEHLDRSQRVLVELVSADGAGATPSGERDRAEQLIVANRLYRATAASAGDASVVDLLDQLERVLVEVAASPSDLSSGEMDDVRRRIESGSLLFKVRVVSSDIEKRRNAAVRHTGQRSSL